LLSVSATAVRDDKTTFTSVAGFLWCIILLVVFIVVDVGDLDLTNRDLLQCSVVFVIGLISRDITFFVTGKTNCTGIDDTDTGWIARDLIGVNGVVGFLCGVILLVVIIVVVLVVGDLDLNNSDLLNRSFVFVVGFISRDFNTTGSTSWTGNNENDTGWIAREVVGVDGTVLSLVDDVDDGDKTVLRDGDDGFRRNWIVCPSLVLFVSGDGNSICIIVAVGVFVVVAVVVIVMYIILCFCFRSRILVELVLLPFPPFVLSPAPAPFPDILLLSPFIIPNIIVFILVDALGANITFLLVFCIILILNIFLGAIVVADGWIVSENTVGLSVGVSAFSIVGTDVFDGTCDVVGIDVIVGERVNGLKKSTGVGSSVLRKVVGIGNGVIVGSILLVGKSVPITSFVGMFVVTPNMGRSVFGRGVIVGAGLILGVTVGGNVTVGENVIVGTDDLFRRIVATTAVRCSSSVSGTS
jgi:hypothetical protein